MKEVEVVVEDSVKCDSRRGIRLRFCTSVVLGLGSEIQIDHVTIKF
jgi:hypothetical protein